MKRLDNTIKDREYLHKLINLTNFPKATITIGGFMSNLASSLTMLDYDGEITGIDLESGYCDWNNETGHKMAPININCITLH